MIASPHLVRFGVVRIPRLTHARGADGIVGTDRDGQGLSVWSLLGIGGFDALCLLGGMAVGWYLDSRWQTLPVFVLVGLAVGVVIAVVGTWAQIRKFL